MRNVIPLKTCFCLSFLYLTVVMLSVLGLPSIALASGSLLQFVEVSKVWASTPTYPTRSLRSAKEPEMRSLEHNPSGEVIFNPENEMFFNQWHSFQVTILRGPITEGLLTTAMNRLRRQTFIQYTSLRNVTKHMIVQVTSEKPDDFTIKPDKPVTLDVIENATEDFSVKPLKFGELKLFLKVKAVVTDTQSHKDASIPFPEQTKVISIKVSPLGTLKYAGAVCLRYWPILLAIASLLAAVLKWILERVFSKR